MVSDCLGDRLRVAVRLVFRANVELNPADVHLASVVLGGTCSDVVVSV